MDKADNKMKQAPVPPKQQLQPKYIQQPIRTVNGDTLLKRYQKIKKVGSGTYSQCFLVKNMASDSTYVVKVIPKKKLQLLIKEKLIYEIKIHQQLSHRNVVHLDHWFEDNEFQFIFMEYCSQGNLEKRLQSQKVTEKDIKHYGSEIVDAISYIHSKNILHRDLKLCNFYLDENNDIKLGDFGFACQLANPNELKRESCGTPNYIAPQAVSGFGYSFSSDVWAIGVILYRLKFKVCPFQGKTVKETLQNVKLCKYNFPKGQKISKQLKDLIQKIFVLNYDDRLTLQQISNHEFFKDIKISRSNSLMAMNPPLQKQKPKNSFSLMKFLFKQKQQKKDKAHEHQPATQPNPQKNKVSDKRSNSCQTFKEIKQIFKNKSKTSINAQHVTQGSQLKTEENSTTFYSQQNTMVSGRDRASGTNTVRSIIDNSFNFNLLTHVAPTKREQKFNRMNNFIGSMKDQLKMKAPPTNIISIHANTNQGNTNNNTNGNTNNNTNGNTNTTITQPVKVSSASQLLLLSKKYYLPYEIQVEKDIVVIHYKPSIKQIIHNGQSIIMHRNTSHLFQMNGSPCKSAHKVVRYVIQNKVEITEREEEEDQFGQNTIERILLFVAHRWIICKEGILLKYGNSSTCIAKIFNQQLFYAMGGQSALMYVKEGKSYKIAEGVVISKIYQGWIGNTIKNHKE